MCPRISYQIRIRAQDGSRSIRFSPCPLRAISEVLARRDPVNFLLLADVSLVGVMHEQIRRDEVRYFVASPQGGSQFEPVTLEGLERQPRSAAFVHQADAQE